MAIQKIKTASGWEVVNGLQPNIIAATDPTTSTIGFVGQLYLNTTTTEVFICTSISGSTYTWVSMNENAINGSY